MKNLLLKILDGLTYKDLAGQRQPRAYTVMTGIILLLLFMVAGVALLNRILVMRKVQETPKAVVVTVQAPSPTPIHQAAQAEPVGCPTEREQQRPFE